MIKLKNKCHERVRYMGIQVRNKLLFSVINLKGSRTKKPWDSSCKDSPPPPIPGALQLPTDFNLAWMSLFKHLTRISNSPCPKQNTSFSSLNCLHLSFPPSASKPYSYFWSSDNPLCTSHSLSPSLPVKNMSNHKVSIPFSSSLDLFFFFHFIDKFSDWQ